MMRTPILVRSASALALVATATCASACKDDGKSSQKNAVEIVDKLAPVVKTDINQLRSGLPEGATKLTALLDADPGANLRALQRAIAGARASVKDLEVAKSTFFSFADPSGTVLRSESDPDMLANRSVLAAFPELKQALNPSSGVTEVFGEMQEMRGIKTGQDLQWVLAHPVKGSDGQLKGIFVTGWSFRAYAYRLTSAADRELHEMAKRDGRKSIPLLYVFSFKGNKVYGEALTPTVNADALEKLDLQAKTASGPWSEVIEIAGRTFGAAAQRIPEFAPDAGVAALVSGI